MLRQHCCFDAEYYKAPRGFCSHTYPSLKFPEDQEALWQGLVRTLVTKLEALLVLIVSCTGV
jgi:dihydroorotase-like cyclic amidohydrolase